jgi:hypothetical protein
VAAEIIHDDDVAGFEEWNELLFDVVPNRFPPIGSKPGMLFEIKL